MLLKRNKNIVGLIILSGSNQGSSGAAPPYAHLQAAPTLLVINTQRFGVARWGEGFGEGAARKETWNEMMPGLVRYFLHSLVCTIVITYITIQLRPITKVTHLKNKS